MFAPTTHFTFLYKTTQINKQKNNNNEKSSFILCMYTARQKTPEKII